MLNHQNKVDLYSVISECISTEIKYLLETKHLYQNTTVGFENIIINTGNNKNKHIEIDNTTIDEISSIHWNIEDPSSRTPIINTEMIPILPRIIVRDVKLFCKTCNREEAFNLVSAEDFLERKVFSRYPPKDTERNNQTFVVSFLCQSCKHLPEVFLIKRQGLKLTLCGRAPIEFIQVPLEIPAKVQLYYKDALLAYQSGQTLAGLFFLRTLIEQFVRIQIKDLQDGIDKIEDIIDQYMKTLPDDFKERFPSIRTIYGDLSNDLHKAEGSTQLFENSIKDICLHFQARKLFRI
jgi:hypothetical protein